MIITHPTVPAELLVLYAFALYALGRFLIAYASASRSARRRSDVPALPDGLTPASRRAPDPLAPIPTGTGAAGNGVPPDPDPSGG